MKNFEEIEQEAINKTQKRRAKVKTSGRSVFLLAKTKSKKRK